MYISDDDPPDSLGDSSVTVEVYCDRNTRNVTIDFSATGTQTCILNGKPFPTCDNPVVVPEDKLSNPKNRLTVTLKDEAGNAVIQAKRELYRYSARCSFNGTFLTCKYIPLS